MVSNQRGQGLIESILAIPMLIAAGSIFLLLLYRGGLYFVADLNLHEALLCTQHETIQICRNSLNERMQKVLLLKESLQIEIKDNRISTSGKITISTTPPLSIEKKIRGLLI